MWDIKPTKGKYDCFLGLIVSYAENFQVDYEMGLLASWGFSYSENSFVPYSNGRDLVEILKKTHGILLNTVKFMNKHELIQQLNVELIHGPVMISVDAIDCPWCMTYEKYSMYHLILVLGIQQEILYCIDSYFSSEGVLKWNIQNKTFEGNLTTFKTNKVMPQKEDYLYQICEAVNHVKENNMLVELESYRDKLMTKGSFDEERRLYQDDYYAIPIVIAFQHLSMSRNNNALALKYIGRKLCREDLFDEAVDSFAKTGNCYEEMKSILIKQIITNRVISSKSEEKMNNIIGAEARTLDIMEKAITILM